jgi:hypothetical protein
VLLIAWAVNPGPPEPPAVADSEVDDATNPHRRRHSLTKQVVHDRRHTAPPPPTGRSPWKPCGRSGMMRGLGRLCAGPARRGSRI